jgi:UDP-N-acetylmuramate dehydrogenase
VSEADKAVATVRDCSAAGQSVLVLAGGSNVVIGDAGFPGVVLLLRTRGVRVVSRDAGQVVVRVAAGEPWDTFVAETVTNGWSGVECLSGIPGSAGATPIQNVGAYGQEVSQTVATVRAYDRFDRKVRTIHAIDCGFTYRSSRFKVEPHRYVVLSVAFQLALGDLSEPIAYAELARTLGVEVGERAPSVDVRNAVLGLRRGKGMVLDTADHDTWSAGSFFTNPILTAAEAETLPADAPRFAQADGRVKTSAAWLIDHAGYGKGYGSGHATLSTKHALALTNRGGATTAELLALAREVRDGVRQAYGITLVNEPVLVGCEL